MRKVILDLAITLDGFIEGPHGEIDWLVSDSDTDFGDILNDILVDIDAIFYGRISYDLWGNYFPPADASQKLQDAYALMHKKTKYVFSTTQHKDNGEAIFIHSNIYEQVHHILQQPGKNIWLYGGSKLTTSFVNLGLIDIYRLAVHPVIIGKGTPLFKGVEGKVSLKLLNVKTSRSGVTMVTYEARKDLDAS